MAGKLRGVGGKGEVTADTGEGSSEGDIEGDGEGLGEGEKVGDRELERERESYSDVDRVRLSVRWYIGGA